MLSCLATVKSETSSRPTLHNYKGWAYFSKLTGTTTYILQKAFTSSTFT